MIVRSLFSAAGSSRAPPAIVARCIGQRSGLALLLMTALITISAGCVDGGQRAARIARQAGFQEDLVLGATFRHRVYRNGATVRRASGPLHIYIEGDGRPFIEPTTVALDPTPRDPLMLRLMALDPAPSVYLGRPCYFGLNRDHNCNPGYWTLKRFSPEVVQSLLTAMRAEIERSGAHRVELYGHSGGGSLAMLLAARVPEVTRVVTIGANLDTAAWCSLHGYTPLLGSLNPVEQSPPPPSVRVLHLVGSEDTNTPPQLVRSAAGTNGSVRVIRGYTHNCCWQEIWPSVLPDTRYDK